MSTLARPALPAAAARPAPAAAPGAAAPAPGDALVADRLSDRLAARLEADLGSGRLQPGDRLPTEAQLSATHGVSRSVVREAVNQLKSRGLLRSRQGSGVYVTQPAAHQGLAFDPSVLGSVDAVLQVVEVRRALEGEIAALAAERANRRQVAAMRRALRTLDAAAAAGGDGVAEDLAFHRAVAQATSNPQFERLLGFLEQYLQEGMRITRGNEARRQDFMDQVRDEHLSIVEAIVARDAAAARAAASAHMQRSEWRLREGGVLPPRRRRA